MFKSKLFMDQTNLCSSALLIAIHPSMQSNYEMINIADKKLEEWVENIVPFV